MIYRSQKKKARQKSSTGGHLCYSYAKSVDYHSYCSEISAFFAIENFNTAFVTGFYSLI